MSSGQLPIDSKWSYATLDASFKSKDDIVGAACAPQIHYLHQLRQGWNTLRVPQSWLNYRSVASVGDTNSWHFHGILVQSILKLIEDDLISVNDADLEAQSPDGFLPTFQLSSDRHPCPPSRSTTADTSRRATRFTSRCQFSQILQYQGVEAFAESAIVAALDGVPSAYVRRHDLSMSFDVDLGDLPIDHIDCVLLYTPVAPTSAFSYARFLHQPISQMNPALVLCAKGPVAWPDSEHRPREFLTTQRSLAALASGSLASILVACQAHSSEHEQESNSFPEWAMTIGIVYDAEAIRFIAHIPYVAPNSGETRFVSVLFDTLPFPACERGELRDFIRDRYRVATALLCIQHHVFRLTSRLWEHQGLHSLDPSRLANILGVELLHPEEAEPEPHTTFSSREDGLFPDLDRRVTAYDLMDLVIARVPTPPPSEPYPDELIMFMDNSQVPAPESYVSSNHPAVINGWMAQIPK